MDILMYRIYHKQGGALTETDLAFGGCIREPQAALYHVTFGKRKQ